MTGPSPCRSGSRATIARHGGRRPRSGSPAARRSPGRVVGGSNRRSPPGVRCGRASSTRGSRPPTTSICTMGSAAGACAQSRTCPTSACGAASATSPTPAPPPRLLRSGSCVPALLRSRKHLIAGYVRVTWSFNCGQGTADAVPVAVCNSRRSTTRSTNCCRSLHARDRARLLGWLKASLTGANRIRAGLPKDWTVGDKTGNGGAGNSAPPHRR